MAATGSMLVFDIGTSWVKGGLVDARGALLRYARAPVRYRAAGGVHEVNPRHWLEAVARTARALVPRGREPLLGLAVSGNGPTLVAAGPSGGPVHPALGWMDRRAVEEAAVLEQAAGVRVSPSSFLPKAAWLRRHRPQAYARTRRFFSCPEYIGYVLTGTAVTVLPAEGYRRLYWSEETLRLSGLDPDRFPPFVPLGARLGPVTEAAAARLGLPAGLPVAAGGLDFLAALLGTATVRPGRVCDRCGSSEGVNLCALRPVEDSRLLSLPHPVDGLYNVAGLIATTGQALEWVRRALGRTRGGLAALLEGMRDAPPDPEGPLFLPHLAGERAPAAFLGLTLRHGAPELCRAVMESVGYAVREVLDVMAEHGLEARELRLSGGQAGSGVWNQIRADITGRAILEPEVHDGELLGAACLGFAALAPDGERDLAARAESLFRVRRVYRPDPGRQAVYEAGYRRWRAAAGRLNGLFDPET